MAVELCEGLFETYKEVVKKKLNRLVDEVAHQILGALINGIEKADEPRYFDLLEKYVK